MSFLSDEWKRAKLTEAAGIAGRIGWKGLTAKEYTAKGPLFLSVHSLNYGDFVDYRDAFHISQARYDESPEIMLRADDVLICKDGAGIGKVGIVGKLVAPTTINSSLLLVRPSKDIVPKFLYYSLLSPQFQNVVKSRLQGATTPHLYQRDIAEFPVVLPSLREQCRIVTILDEAFEAIAAATANAEKSLANARELFELSVDTLVGSKLGSSWARTQIGNVATTEYGLSGTLNTEGKGYKIFRMGEVQDGRMIDTGRMKFIDITGTEFDACRLSKGDVLFNRTNSADLVGKTGYFDLDGDYCFASYLVRVNFDEVSIRPKFASYLMNSRSFLSRIRSKAARSVNQANINATILRNEFIDFPRDIQVQDEVVATLDSLEAASKQLEAIYHQKISRLDELRQAVLRRAFSGKPTASPAVFEAAAE